jgi:hypothetical protein
MTILAAVALATGCSAGGDDSGSSPGTGDGAAGTTTTTEAAPTAAALCADAEAVQPVGQVAQDGLVEASGIAASRRNAGVLWSHNDSGGAPEVFALDEDGGDRGRFTLQGAEAVDWEDIALAPGDDTDNTDNTDNTDDAQPGGVLYLADIGDNNEQRPSVTVYRAPEPALRPGAAGGTITGVEAIPLTYADGPHNAEALLADPVTGDLFIVTKVVTGTAGAYRIPAGSGPGAPVTMVRAGDVAVPAGSLVTGGDVSPDGSLVALRTYSAVLLWDRAEGQTVAEALAGRPCEAQRAVESQGEAIAFAADGKGYVTVSEGAHPAVNGFYLP